MTLPFITGWEITLKDIPKYTEFEGKFIEKLDYPILQIFCESDNPVITTEMKSLLKNKILDKMDKQTGELEVQHHNTTHKLGRYYSKEDTSIIPHSKFIKHTILFYLGWDDLDMIKGHPTIAYEMGKLIGEDFKHIKNYIDNFDEYVDELIEFYGNPNITEGEIGLEADDIKWLFVLTIYGGNLNTWVKGLTQTDPVKGYKPRSIKNETIAHPKYKDFQQDCLKITKLICKNNRSLYKKLHNTGESAYETNNRMTSYWFQAIENHILYIVYNYLVELRIIKPKHCGLEYDGLCIPPTKTVFNKETLVNNINQLIVLKTGINVKMKFKDYNKKYVLDSIIQKRQQLVIAQEVEAVNDTADNDEDDEVSKQKFKEMVADFEKNHCKIINSSCYVKDTGGDFLFLNKQKLIASYEHIRSPSGKKPFILDWISYEGIRVFETCDVYPNTAMCPKNIFNLWRPFEMEKHTTTYETDIVGLEMFKNHLLILCNRDAEIALYFGMWIAYLIQYPERKSITPVLISKQGAGKNTLIEALKKMLGGDKVLETSNPARDIWGNFNGLMKNAYLVHLNELNKKDTVDSFNKIKALQTDPTIAINDKGASQINIKSYHHFIASSNDTDGGGIPTSKDDRRNVIIRTSDELIGNKEYFNKFYEKLNEPAFIRTLYDYFKNMKDIEGFMNLPIPVSAFQKNLSELTRSPVDLWLEDFTRNHCNEKEIEMTTNTLYGKFSEWMEKAGYEYNVNKCQFGVRLTNLNVKGIETIKGRLSNSKHFDISKLREHYHIGIIL